MIGADITQVLDPKAEEEVMLTVEIPKHTKKLTPNQLSDLFYSCLRGYGWKG